MIIDLTLDDEDEVDYIVYVDSIQGPSRSETVEPIFKAHDRSPSQGSTSRKQNLCIPSTSVKKARVFDVDAYLWATERKFRGLPEEDQIIVFLED